MDDLQPSPSLPQAANSATLTLTVFSQPNLFKSKTIFQKSPVTEHVQGVRAFKQQAVIPTVCQPTQLLEVDLREGVQQYDICCNWHRCSQ